MPDTFDPYRKWLGIPPAEQPSNHYRLLGIALFEDDPDVIESAADQRMSHVRTFQAGKHSALSQRILNELAAARLCLLNPASREAYDDELRRRAVPVAVAVAVAEPAPAMTITDRPRSRTSRTRGRRLIPAAQAWLLLAAVAIPAAIFVGYLVSTKGGQAVAEVQQKEPPPERVKQPVPPKPVQMPAGETGKAKRFAFDIPDRHLARWRLDGDELVQSSQGENLSIVFGEPTWEDVDISVEAQLTGGNDLCGILCRYQDEGNLERYVVGAYGNTWHFSETVNGDRNARTSQCRGSLVPGKWHRLEFQMRGAHGDCFLDGERILNLEMPRRGRGRVGLVTTHAAYRFRNITVKSPDGKVLLEGLPDLDAEPPSRDDENHEKKPLVVRGGILPIGANGQPLNFDFETGNLRDWTVEGSAFAGQPTKGDTLHARYRYLSSGHCGKFWIGGDETIRDAAKGTLTSVPFKVTHPFASFLMAGGGRTWVDASVELVERDGHEPFFRAIGNGSDVLTAVVVDLTAYMGKEIFIRVADRSDGPLGHVSFDDFRLHDRKPDLSPLFARVSAMRPGAAIDLLKSIDVRRDGRAGAWYRDAQNRLVVPAWGWKMLQAPLAVPNEYDVSFTVEGVPRVCDLHIVLPVGRRQAFVVLDGWGRTASGFELLDGKPGHSNESTHRGVVLLDDRPNKVVCQVREGAVKVLCNGAAVIDWRGDPARLSLPRGADRGTVAGWYGILVGGGEPGFRLSQLEVTPVAASSAPAAPPAKPRSLGDLVDDGNANLQKLTAAEAFSLQRHEATVTRLAFHRSQPLLASAGKDGRVLLWNLQTRAVPLELHKFGDEAWAVKFHPGGDYVAFANRSWWGSRLFFETLAGQQLNEVKDFKNPGGEVTTIAYSHDGRLLAAGQINGTIRLWDVAQFREIPPVAFGDGHDIYALAFGAAPADRKSKLTRYLLAAGGRNGMVKTLTATLDNKNGQWIFKQTQVNFPAGGPILSLRFSPKGELLGSTRADGLVSLCDPHAGKLIRDLARGGGSAEWIAFHPQQPWCLTAHKNEQAARIWNTETAELLCELKGHSAGVMCAEFSPDGRQVATASEDLSIKVWNLAGPDVPAAPDRRKRAKSPLPIVGD